MKVGFAENIVFPLFLLTLDLLIIVVHLVSLNEYQPRVCRSVGSWGDIPKSIRCHVEVPVVVIICIPWEFGGWCYC